MKRNRELGSARCRFRRRVPSYFDVGSTANNSADWRRALKAAKLPRRRIHELRHAFVSASQVRLDLVVAEIGGRLLDGHAQVSTVWRMKTDYTVPAPIASRGRPAGIEWKLGVPRINYRRATAGEIGDVARNNRQVVLDSSGGD